MYHITHLSGDAICKTRNYKQIIIPYAEFKGKVNFK